MRAAHREALRKYLRGRQLIPPHRRARRSTRSGGKGGYKKTEDQPHALALTIGKNTSERRKTGGRREEISSARQEDRENRALGRHNGIQRRAARDGREKEVQHRLGPTAR